MKLLAAASRPSDYVEMVDLAIALANRAHDVTLLYFYSPADASLDSYRREATRLNETIPRLSVQLRDTENGDADGGQPGGTATPLSRALAARIARRFSFAWNNLHLLPGVLSHLTVLSRVPPSKYLLVPRALYQGWAMVSRYAMFLNLFASEIQRGGFEAALIPEDIVGPIWPTLVRAGHDCGIPVLVFPYTLANREEAIQSLRDHPSFQASHNQIAARMYPRWRFQRDGVDLVRLPTAEVLAHHQLAIAPPDPWMMNSGYADAICVDSQASFDYFVAADIPRDRLRLVGSVSHDRMFELQQAKRENLHALRGQLGLAGEKPLLLLSGCPNQLSADVPHCDFTTMERLAAFVGESLAPLAADYHLVVRPHPNFLAFGEMLAAHGLISTEIPTSRLVPLADAFVAFASATIRWAIACAVPTVNYDVFHYGYGDFAAVGGVVGVTKREQFQDTVRALRPGSDLYRRLAAAIQDDRRRWSMMDGQGVPRIERELAIANARVGKGAAHN